MTVPGGIGPWLPVVAVSVAALPLAYLAYRVRLRQTIERGGPQGQARRSSAAEIGMLVGTLPWLWMVLTPTSGAGGLQLVPLVDLMHVLTGDPSTAIVQVGGNLLVFAAFGFFAPLRWPIRTRTVTLIAAGGSLVVEFLQFALSLGRVTSVDDVLLNAAGAGLAALLGRQLLGQQLPGRPRPGQLSGGPPPPPGRCPATPRCPAAGPAPAPESADQRPQ
jgi:hypothetical protein